MTTAICAFMKKENAYIDEWLKHHLSIGIDKIILFDNNDGMEDYPMTEFVSRQVMAKRVKVINKRNTKLNKEKELKLVYDACKTDWICFIDIDEFIYVRDGKTIKEAISNSLYKDAQNVLMPSIVFGDSNNVYKDDNNVMERFSKMCITNNKYTSICKAFIKTKISSYKTLSSQGIIYPGVKSVSSSGSQLNPKTPYINWNDVCPIEIHAYPTKSLEEYCTVKVHRNTEYDADKIEEYKNKYFSVNTKTADKEALFDLFINKAYNSDESNEGMHSYAEFNIGNGESNNAN